MTTTSNESSAKKPAAKKSLATKSTAKKAPAKASAATASAAKAPIKKAVATKAAVAKAPAKKVAAKAAPATTATTKRVAAKKMAAAKATTKQPVVTSPILRGGPMEPEPPVARFKAPRGEISPDRSATWLKRAYPLVKAHGWLLGPALALSFVALVLTIQVPTLLNDAIAKSLIAKTTPLSHYVWLISILTVITFIAGYYSRMMTFKTAFRLEFDLRNKIYEHLSKMSFGFFDTAQTGQLISRANSDIRSVQGYLTFGPSILVQCAGGVVAFFYMLRLSVPLAFLSMLTTPLVYFAGVRMRSVMFPVSWLIQARLADVATIVDENINGVRVVKSFAAESHELKELTKASDRLSWAYIKDADLRGRYSPWMIIMPSLGMVILLLAGGYLVIHGHIGIGVILADTAYVFMLQGPFQMIGMLIMMGQRAKASAERIYEILDTPADLVDAPDAKVMTECHGEVVFDNVSFAYPSTGPGGPEILSNFTLRMHPGETVAIVGATGCGKSTVARLLPRFYDVTGGSITIDGVDVRETTLTSLRHQIGIVVDEPFLFSDSIRDNITFGRPDATEEEVVAAAKAAGADGFIRHLENGYDTVVGERGYTISGGQRQRVAIARALLLNPPILVLDDATSAVDVKTELRIHDALEELMHSRTTLIIAHRLSTISLADRVVLMDEGRIVADGTHNELMESSPLYLEILAQTIAVDDAGDLADDDEDDETEEVV